MIAWLNPAAFVTIAAVSAPLIIHLLLRQRARRVVFPSVRFIAKMDESSMRFRAPSDLLLLLVRLGIVACAALALAQPLLVSDSRLAAWGDRTVRAVVVDTSDSVDGRAAREAADAEARGAVAVRRFESPDPSAELAKAVAWLNAAGPARRELVVLSDFQNGILTRSQVERVPPTMGIRLVRLAARTAPRTQFDAGAVLHGDEELVQRTELAGPETSVTLRRESPVPGGLQLLTDERERRTVEALMHSVRAAGAVSPSSDHPISIRFRGAAAPAQPEEASDEWVRQASMRLLISPALQGIRTRVAQRNGALAVDVDTPADSWNAVAVLQAALNARRDERAWREREPQAIPDGELAAWMRETPLPEADAWRRTDGSDGHWLWLAALVLIGFETMLRRTPASRGRVQDERAA